MRFDKDFSGYLGKYDYDPDNGVVRFWMWNSNRWSLPVLWTTDYEEQLPEDYREWLPER